MKGDDLPPEDHIVRYVKPRSIRQDKTVDGSAFLRRQARPDEVGLSAHWLEILGLSTEQQLAAVRQLNRLKRNNNGRFAEMIVGEVLRNVSRKLDTLRIVEDPLDANDEFDADPSHAQIIGVPPADAHEALMIGDLIAECVVDMHLAND